MDDAVAAVDAAGVEKLALIGDTEGGPMAMLFAATFADRVSALVLANSFARWQRADDYPIGMPAKTTAKLLARWQEKWGVTSEIWASRHRRWPTMSTAAVGSLGTSGSRCHRAPRS